MAVALIDHPDAAGYRLTPDHPLRPERFTLAIELMRAWHLLSSDGVAADRALILRPQTARREELLLAHDERYVQAVEDASHGKLDPARAGRFGLGPGDTPAFLGMHQSASVVVGASVHAVDVVLDGTFRRAHNPSGGLHHAHRDRASGFCVYNDAVVAIEHAVRARPGLRVAYLDIDAHHGDGVEAAFAARSDVLTVSVHESGMFLFPGTGRITDAGTGDGLGFAVNVPLLPHCGPESYPVIVERVIGPALERFRPDLIVLQAGADSHRNDPLTHLEQSVSGFDAAVALIVELADRYCDGRLVVLGGGGYDTFSAVPRMWACVMSRLLGRVPPPTLPETWKATAEEAAAAAGHEPPALTATFDERIPDVTEDVRRELLGEVNGIIARLKATHPLFA